MKDTMGSLSTRDRVRIEEELDKLARTLNRVKGKRNQGPVKEARRRIPIIKNRLKRMA